MKKIHMYGKSRTGFNGQRGGLTIFSAALILILMTMVLLYATRVSVFESRISGNEVRQKEAFHVAEAALEQGMMYLLANTNVILSSRENVFPDGTVDGFSKDGWLPPSSGAKWAPCPSTPALEHPCGGDISAKPGSFFYDTDGNAATLETLPVNQLDFPTGTTARMNALMCFVDLDDPTLDDPTAPCGAPGAPTTPDEESNAALVITLLAYGYSDCTDVNKISTCIGEATVAMPVGTDRLLNGSPAVPLVAKSTVPLDGTFEIVGNPNGGGVGVPLTTWKDGTAGLLSSGTWQTCEMEEWYHQSYQPEDVACEDNNCSCVPEGAPASDTSNFLSYRGPGGETVINIDIIEDPEFPDDLFYIFFGIDRGQYWSVKGPALQKTDCTDLGPGSNGLIWITGSDCSINAGTVVGSPLNPVMLVSAADLTSMNGGAVLFGVLYIFDGDDDSPGAAFKSTGGATVYGAVIVDGEIDKLQGTFQVVYNHAVIAAVAGLKGVGAVNGGWRDFGLPDIGWPDVVVAP